MADKTVIVSDNSLSVTENQSVDITTSLNTVSASVNTDSKSLTYEDNIFYVTPYDNKFVSGTSTPVWVQNLVDLSVNTGLSTVDTKIDALRLYVDQQDVGITQEIISTNTNIDSLNALITTVKSQVDTNTASIGNIQLTYATKDYVGTEVITLMESKWNTYADSFIATVDSTYADNFQTWSNRVTTLESSYTDLVTNTNITSIAQDQFFTKAGIDSTTGELSAQSGWLAQLLISGAAGSISLLSEDGISLGYNEWDKINPPKIGDYTIDVNGIIKVFVGGTAGVNKDGWIVVESTSSINYINNTLTTITNAIADINNQIDGTITTWFDTKNTEFTSVDAKYQSTQTSVNLQPYDTVWDVASNTMYEYTGQPEIGVDLTLETYPSPFRWRAISNLKFNMCTYPTDSWVQEDLLNGNDIVKNSHLGDLAYNIADGKAYRFSYQDLPDNPDQGAIYSWVLVTDTDITTALANAASAKDTADGKRNIFTTASLPSSWVGANGTVLKPEEGDLWIPTKTTPDEVIEAGYVEKEVYVYKETSPGSGVFVWVVATKYTEDLSNYATIIDKYTQGTVTITYAPEPKPINPSDGDWYITSATAEMFTVDANGVLNWVDKSTTKAGQDLIKLINTAITADSKIYFFKQNTKPTTGMSVGDIWLDTSKDILYIYDGTAWVLQNKPGRYFTGKFSLSAPTTDPDGVLIDSVTNPYTFNNGDLWGATDQWYDINKKFPKLRKYLNGLWVDLTQEEAENTSWYGGSSKLLRGVDGSITGWEFYNGDGTTSNFAIHADKFFLTDTNGGYDPNTSVFTVDTVTKEVTFNGKVSFNNVTGAPTNVINLVPSQYSTFTSTPGSLPPTTYNSSASTLELRTDAAWVKYMGQTLMLWATAPDAYVYLGTTTTDYNIPIIPGKTYIFSAYLKVNGGTKNCQLYIRTSDGVHYGKTITLNNTYTWERVHMVWTAPAGVTSCILRIDNDGYAGVNVAMSIDGVMFEEVDSSVTEPSPFTISTVGTALTDMSNVTTIDGGKITTGSLRANQLYTNRLVNIGAYNTDGTINESAVTMDINFGSGYIYIK